MRYPFIIPILLGTALVAGCANYSHQVLADGRHSVSYSEPLANWNSADNLLGRRAKEICPHGFEKERSFVRTEPDGDVYVWHFRCLMKKGGYRNHHVYVRAWTPESV